jgi:putative transferase (TIGR04331 family)
MYDRYKNIKKFTGLYPEFYTLCLSKDCFVVPKDSLDYTLLIGSDEYNLQLYSSILTWLGYSFPEKSLSVNAPELGVYVTGNAVLRRKILKDVCSLACKALPVRGKVLFRHTYFSKPALMRMVLRSGGAIWPCFEGYTGLPEFSPDQSMRSKIVDPAFGEDEFEKMLASMVGRDIPGSMVEGFGFLREESRRKLPSGPKAIMSGISWWYDNLFRVWVAGSAEEGSLLLGVQHGAGYGVHKELFAESVELGIVDKFYSWGWERQGCHAEVVPMPSVKLSCLKKKRKHSSGILYATTVAPRYLCWFPWSIDNWEQYFANQQLFLAALSQEAMSRLRVRPHREDLGWDVLERIRDKFPQIMIEGWDKPINKSLNGCSVYVCDMPLDSTIFTEALTMNKPTVAFYGTILLANPLTNEAEQILERLKSVSIVFDDPLKAARHLNSILGREQEWWNESQRQDAVRGFLNRFARGSSVWLKEWSKELADVAKHSV